MTQQEQVVFEQMRGAIIELLDCCRCPRNNDALEHDACRNGRAAIAAADKVLGK